MHLPQGGSEDFSAGREKNCRCSCGDVRPRCDNSHYPDGASCAYKEASVRNPLYNLSVFKFGYASAQIIPRPIAQRIADGFAWWSLRNVPELHGMVRGNLAVATGKNGPELDGLVRENVRTFSRMLADYFLCAGDRCCRAKELVAEWQGLENIS